MTTGFEVSQLQTNLSDARSRELNALVIYRKAVAAYHDSIADILEWKGVKIEGMPDMAPPADRATGATCRGRVARPRRAPRSTPPGSRDGAGPAGAARFGPRLRLRAARRGLRLLRCATFAAIAAQPTWLVPLLLWTALSFLVSAARRVADGLAEADREDSAEQRGQPLTDAQIEQAVEQSRKMSRGSSRSSPVFVPVLLAVITAGVSGWPARPSAGSSVPAVLRRRRSMRFCRGSWSRSRCSRCSGTGRRSTRRAWATSCRPTRASSSAPRAPPRCSIRCSSSLDLLSFWTMGLLVLGLSAATRAPRGRMAVLVFEPLGPLRPRKGRDCGDLFCSDLARAARVETPEGENRNYPPGRALTHADRHPGHHEGLRDGRGEGPRARGRLGGRRAGRIRGHHGARPAPASRP